MPVNQKVPRMSEATAQRGQRLRSSCQSQNKLLNQGSKTSLLPQR